LIEVSRCASRTAAHQPDSDAFCGRTIKLTPTLQCERHQNASMFCSAPLHFINRGLLAANRGAVMLEVAVGESVSEIKLKRSPSSAASFLFSVADTERAQRSSQGVALDLIEPMQRSGSCKAFGLVVRQQHSSESAQRAVFRRASEWHPIHRGRLATMRCSRSWSEGVFRSI
jgi:hypothetical protein